MPSSSARKCISYLWILPASAVYALGFNWCFAPNHIAFGGLTGAAQIVNRFLPQAPVGAVVILLNIPLFLLGWRLLGGKALAASLYAMLLSSAAIDLLARLHTFQPMADPLLAALYGGVLMGASLGVILLQGATTGGTDLLARLLQLRLSWLPMGKLLLGIDLAVVAAAAAAFGDLDSALYGAAALYVSSRVMDLVLYGLDTSKVACIISQKHQALSARLTRELERGVTLLQGRGAWSGQETQVLLCAFKQRQIAALKQAVRELDSDAFLIVCDAREVAGLGFRART